MIDRRLVVALSLWSAGCVAPQGSTGVGNPGLTQSEQALVDDGAEGTRAGDVASAIVSIPLLAIRAADTTDETAAAVAVESGTPALFPGCLTVVRNGTTATFTFADCPGRFGLSGLSGDLVAVYSRKAGGGLQIRVDSRPDFGLDFVARDGRTTRVAVVLQANAEVTVEGGVRKIRWNGDYAARVGAFEVTHRPSYDASVDLDTQCVSVNGVAATNAAVPARAIDTTVTGYVRCGPRSACPEAGGKVTYTRRIDGAELTVEFLGGRSARVTGPNRPATVVPDLLQCTPR